MLKHNDTLWLYDVQTTIIKLAQYFTNKNKQNQKVRRKPTNIRVTDLTKQQTKNLDTLYNFHKN